MSAIKHLTAAKLRLILAVMMFVTVGICGTIFYFANSLLSDVATDVSKTVAEANASQNNLQTLQQTEKILESEQDAVKRAAKVTANSQNYQYQNQIINDMNEYASRAGITLTNIDFSSAKPSSAAPATGGAAAPMTGAGTPTGVKTVTISVTIDNPVNYVKLLRFMRSIEQNLTKMQIADISLTQSEAGVSSDVLTIMMYVR